MKRAALLLLAALASLTLGACGPGTPGTGALCGDDPPPEACPSGWVCQCFLAACGWGCPGAAPDVPDGGAK